MPASNSGPDPTRIDTLTDLAREIALLRSRAARGTRSAKVGLDDLVERVGEPRSTVHAYLSGRRLAPAQVLDRIVIALGATPTEQREWADAWDRVSANRDARRIPLPAPERKAVLHQLPQAVEDFTGRAEELAELDLLLSRSQAGVIAAVCGTAGVGKSALAVQWAQTRSSKFPDGQLYLDLRGFDPERPVPPAQALARFLRALGVAEAELPAELAECAALYRSLLSGRRMLILLDNARDVEQIRPLLPGTASCSVLVTSRDSLTGLIARNGAYRVELDVLTAADASTLLCALITGAEQTGQPAIEELAEQCAWLPLALRIAAELAMSQPGSSLDSLVGELATGHRRLDLLDAGDDPRTAIRAVFSWSYQLLPADAARAFRLLGLHPGADLAPPALAALCELSLPEAQRVLGLLSRAHLVEQRVAGRYGLHRLLDDYANELTTSTDSDRDRWTAQTRLFDYYLHTAARAMDLLFPTRSHHRPQLPPGSVETDWLTDLATARRWLDAERANLVAIAIQAGRKGWPWHTIRLAQTIAHYLNSAAHHREALTLHRSARSAAQACEDQRGEAASLNDLGTAAARLGLPEAIGSFQRALALYLELGDRPGQGRVLGNLGHVYRRLGRHAEALEHYRRHLEMHRAIGDLVEQATALNSLGALHFSLGNHAESLRHYEQALTICRDNGDIEGQARTLGNLAETYLHLGNYGQARSSQQLALQKYQQAGDHGRAAATLAKLEGTAERQARDTAARNLQQAAGD